MVTLIQRSAGGLVEQPVIELGALVGPRAHTRASVPDCWALRLGAAATCRRPASRTSRTRDRGASATRTNRAQRPACATGTCYVSIDGAGCAATPPTTGAYVDLQAACELDQGRRERLRGLHGRCRSSPLHHAGAATPGWYYGRAAADRNGTASVAVGAGDGAARSGGTGGSAGDGGHGGGGCSATITLPQLTTTTSPHPR
jgi:hypothetical protein